MRYLVGFLVPACLMAFSVGCSAGSSADLGSGGTGGSGTGNGTTGTGFGAGSGGSTGQGCSDPACIGNAMQGGCDTNIAIGSANAMDGAKAIGLCQVYSAGGWGVVQADWVRSDGSPLGMGDGGLAGDGDLQLGKGILTHLGAAVTPREGAAMLGLSSGSARDPGDPGYHDVGGYWKDNNPHGAPAGYPKEAPSCQGIQTAPTGSPYDSAGLRLKIHTPKDAKSISYNLNFHTYEFPNFICSEYNDFFVALLTPKPANLPDANISFDTMGNNVSVNAGFLQVCDPQNAGGKDFPCALGSADLGGTGFEGHAATGWLETKAPVAPDSEITLHFAIWDSGDGVLDSTVLVDNFKFQLSDTMTGTTPIPK